MLELKRLLKVRFASRKESGWKEMCFEKGPSNVRKAFFEQIGDVISAGKNPEKARKVANDMLFNGVDVLDIDILMRLK